MSRTPDVLRLLAERGTDDGPWALATVVETRGSTPRKEGARMLVGSDGRVVAGTVGGGCGEGQVLETAREVIGGAPPRMVRVDLTHDLITLSPAVCGGTMDVWVERVEP